MSINEQPGNWSGSAGTSSWAFGLWLHVLYCSILFDFCSQSTWKNFTASHKRNFEKLTQPKEPETTPVYIFRALVQPDTEPVFLPKNSPPPLQAEKLQGDRQLWTSAVLLWSVETQPQGKGLKRFPQHCTLSPKMNSSLIWLQSTVEDLRKA